MWDVVGGRARGEGGVGVRRGCAAETATKLTFGVFFEMAIKRIYL